MAEAFAEPRALHRGMVQEIAGSRGPTRFSDAELAADRPQPRRDAEGEAMRSAIARGAAWPA